MRFQLPALPYAMNAFEPFMSERTMNVHYNGHHKKYVETVNELLDEIGSDEGSLERIIQNHDGKLYNNAAQAWNHTFFWHGLCPAGQSEMPEDNGDFDQAVERSFGSWESVQKSFNECAKTVFGSGYVWLTVDGQKHVEFLATQNAGNPLRFDRVRPLWTCDLWEHAYYLDYQNQRARFVEKIWNHINWDFVENNFLHDGLPNMTKFMISSAKMEAAIGQHSARVFE